jgi:single-stranded-DNA-specific exonuclease
MEPARWLVDNVDTARAIALADAVGLHRITAQLLVARGVVTPDAAQNFLNPRLALLRRPDEMAGFAPAVARLHAALVAGETVGVFGDYDVDGVTSCALLTTFLRQAGGRVFPRVAERDHGYGFGPDDVCAFSDAGCALIVTCDCGTSDHLALAAARAAKIDVIIVDHHQVPERMPDALALINPHQAGCGFAFKGLASAGVAFYLAAALRTRLRDAGWSTLPDPRSLLDLVALGTVCDLAPLTDENRILVATGLQMMKASSRPGVRALCALGRLPDGVRRASDLGMRLGPRLNAPGRLGSASLALELLLAADDEAAAALGKSCEDANRRRRLVQDRVLADALPQAEAAVRRGAPMLVVHGEGWHAGVVGIVAARLVDRFQRPAAVIAVDGDTGRGSLRSARGLQLHKLLEAAGDLLLRHGGHAAAAGLTVERSKLPSLVERLESLAGRTLGQTPPPPEVRVDAVVELADIDHRLARDIARLEPFGMGNPEPLLGVRDVVLAQRRVVKEQHVQIALHDGIHYRHGIGFQMAERAPTLGSRVQATFLPEIDVWQGEERIRVRLRALEHAPRASLELHATA